MPKVLSKTDFDTSNAWKNVYGASGYFLATGDRKLPDGVTVKMPEEIKSRELKWPDGVRRFSYRTWPVLPVGHFTPSYDNVQIAFNVLGANRKATWAQLPGTTNKLLNYQDTDYEYALNTVAPEFGGGTEIWRLLVPGMPRKNFYPRQPKSPFDGPVKNGQLVTKHAGNTRIIECALPWSEIPDVKIAMQQKRPIKFSFLVNDAGAPGQNGAGVMELSKNRSVAKPNYYAFHVDWAGHWANELLFGWQK